MLDLNGLYLDTTNDYGLRLPKDCTVNITGTNYIKASKYALSCAGTVVFKGSGKLILDAGEAGIFIYTEVGTDKVRLLEGALINALAKRALVIKGIFKSMAARRIL